MYLKTIEITGFKSFAVKTELRLRNGITGIVGPNGSGKSNISDAVRWVLGEQSIKSLRGGKMEDVIFAGTQYRKAIGLAQVSLTLDNTDGALKIDFSEVTITRKLYRSGDSEYYINNTLCRLRDIQEMFMDTGIGKEGYSIIGQGKIDAILSGRPEERRSLLEEAAGVVKYKSRKEESEKKLQSTDQNLARITDIISTYEERIEPLKIENEKAKSFIKLSDTLKRKEINSLVTSIEIIDKKMSRLQISITKSTDYIHEITNDKNESLDNNDSNKENLETLELKVENEKHNYYEKKAEHQSMSSEIGLLDEKLNNLNKFISKSLEEVSNTNNESHKIQILKDTNKRLLLSLKEDQNKLSLQIKQKTNQIYDFNGVLVGGSEELKKYKDNEMQLLNKIAEFKNNIALIKNNIDLCTRDLDQLKKSSDTFTSSMGINNNNKTLFTDNNKLSALKVDTLNLKVIQNRNELANVEVILSKDELSLKENINIHNKLETTCQMLQNLEKQYEGYNKSVKTLMIDIARGKANFAVNNCSIVGEVIIVDKRLETSIEVALGSSISNIITQDDNTAKKLIDYLKSNNLGRATFLPLNIIKGKKLNEADSIKTSNGYLGIASDLINYDIKYKKAVEFLLGRTLVVTDMDCSLNIAKLSNYSFKIVTLSGEVLSPGGSLTGGSLYHKNTSIIGRKREISEMSKDLVDISSKIEVQNRKISFSKSEIKKIEDIHLEIKDKIYGQNIEITKILEKIKAINIDNEKLKVNLNICVNETSLVGNKIKDYNNNLYNTEKDIKEILEEEHLNKSNISKAENTTAAANINLDIEKEELTKLKVKKATIDESLINSTKEEIRHVNDINILFSKIANIQINIKENELNKETCNNNIFLQTGKVKLLNTFIDNLESSLKQNDIEVLKLKELVKNSSSKIDQLLSVLSFNEDECHKQQINYAKLETEKEMFFAKLNEEMKITYAEALDYKCTISNFEEYKNEIISLKNTITSLGIVNLAAIQEFQEVTEKCVFMNFQKEDLKKAKNDLEDVISDMTDKIKKIFKDNFNKLRENFNETFRELFKGGTADLILADGDELTANIDISVQPPGKKLQNINLMSGGEKVLSAIALLFAILKMKPSPFCILDEIEAALDDANVVRYAEFLKKFSDNIQFIIITHRKGTMECCNVLFGVTMAEKGISKIVSVNMNRFI